jgi:hypothetical protein
MSGRGRVAVVLRMLLCACAVCVTACGRQHAASATPAATSATPDTAAATSTDAPPTAVAPAALASNCLPTQDGYLRLRMRGDANMDIDWHDADMHCDGGPRPGQKGLRLTFAGPIPGAAPAAHHLRFVFGIAATPGAREQRNVAANVTVIFEGERKLFSTAGDGRCTIDEFSEQPLPAPANPNLRRLTARGFCTAPATALAGSAQLLLSRFDFAGPIINEDPADAPPPATP